MQMPRLEWRTLTDSRSPKFFVKGTRLAVAYFHYSRFAIYEVRGSANADGSYSDFYVVKDAETVSDADVKAGVAPKEVWRGSDLQKFFDLVVDSQN